MNTGVSVVFKTKCELKCQNKLHIFFETPVFLFSLLRIFDGIFDVIIDVVERLCLGNKYKSMFVNQKQDAYYVSMYIIFFLKNLANLV